MAHQEFGVRLLERVKADLEPYGTVEQFPKMEGRQLVMVLAPLQEAEKSAEGVRIPPAGAGGMSEAARQVMNKWLRVVKRSQDREPPGAMLKGDSSMPKMKTKSGAPSASRSAAGGQRQAFAGVQAPYPDQENHQDQASAARHGQRP
jgi:hypothetical protein